MVFAQLNALFAGVLFATGGIVVDKVPPVRFAALMYLITAPVNTLWWWLTRRGYLPRIHPRPEGSGRRFTRHDALWVGIHSLCSVAGIALLWAGMARLETAVGSLLSRLEVVVAVMLGLAWLGERLSRPQWLGLIVTLAGAAIIRWTVLAGEPLGFLLLVLSALSFGLAEVTGKVAVRTVPVPKLVLIRGWVMLLCLVILAQALEPGWQSLTPTLWGLTVLSAFLGPVLSRNSYMLALSYLPVSLVVLLNQTQPLYAALAAYLMRGEVPSRQTCLGGLVLLIGVAVLAWRHIDGARRRALGPSQATGGSSP